MNEKAIEKLMSENKIIDKTNIQKANDMFFKEIEQTAQTKALKDINAYEKLYNSVSETVNKILPCS